MDGRTPDPLTTTPCQTVGDLCERFRAWHLPFIRSGEYYNALLNRHFPPLYELPLQALTKSVVLGWRAVIGQQHPQAANTALDLLRNLLNRGKEWDLYHGADVTAGIKRFPEPSRGRFLYREEWERVKAVLDQQPSMVRVYFSLLIYEGPRMSEARYMEWAHLDLREGLWRKPLTKNGRTHVIELGPQTCALLRQLPRYGRYVFYGDPTNNHVNQDCPWSRTSLQYHWKKIRTQAGVPDVRIHDLRRTFATWLAMQGENLITIQNALGHNSLDATKIYVQHVPATLRAAKSRLAERLMATTVPCQSEVPMLLTAQLQEG